MGIQASSNKIDNAKKSASTSPVNTTLSIPSSPLDIEVENLETFIIVWLDANIDDAHNQALQKRLRQYVTFFVTFNEIQLCEQWLKSRSNHEKILLIVPGELGRRMVPNIYQITSIIAIYVFCYKPENHLIWTQNYTKIRGVISKPENLLQQISKDQIYFENIEDSKAIQIFKDRRQSRVIDPENASFLWYQLFLEIIISSSYLQSPNSPTELIRILRRFSSNETEGLNLIKQFEETYDKQKAVTWLINNTALSRFLNKALREQNIPMLFYLRFFLIDIYNELMTHQSRSERVYRKQLMASAEIENIRANLNQYLIFNGFLLTSTHEPDLSSIDNTDNQFQTVFIEIDADDLDENTPFAYLNTMADTANTLAILFMCGTIFKIISFTKNQNSTWNLHLSLVGHNDLNILTEKKQKLRQNKDLLMISDLLDKCNQSNKAIVYCQHLLRELPSNHVLVPQLKDKINMNSKAQPVSLKSVQFILIDLSTRLSQLASAMLDALRLLTNDSILILDKSSEIDTMSNKAILLFTSSQTNSSMTKKPKQLFKLFLLEEDRDKVDQRERFDNSEDLIFQLADELYQYYNGEANDDSRSGDQTSAKQKEEIANRIHSELKKAHQKFSALDIDKKSSICTATTLVWLKSKQNNNNSMERLQNLLKDIISSFSTFDDEHQCYQHMCTTEFDNIVFLIIDTSYKEVSVIGFHQLTNVKKLYRYGQSSSTNETISGTPDELCLQLTHDLIAHYNKLGSECKARNDVKQSKEMFLKAHELCKRLIKL